MTIPGVKVDGLRLMANEYVECFRRDDFDDDDLHDYIRIVLGIDVPRRPFCSNHIAPFQFVADVFFGRCEGGAAIGFANRGGGKTLNLAIIENAGMKIREPLEICHYGSVKYQASKCYEYFKIFAGSEHLADDFPSTTKENAQTVGGSKLGIFPATLAAVSGQHPNWAFLDEVETLKRHGVIEKFRGMSQHSERNHGIDIYTSTRDKAYGPFQRLLEWAKEHGIGIYKWCIWDVLSQCPSDRECKRCPKMTQERCEGKAKLARGFYPIEDFIRRAASLDDETWEAQFLCLRPQRTGAVYKEFDEDVHVSKEPLKYNNKWPVWLVGDPGWRAADAEGKRGKFVVCDFQKDPYDRIHVIRERRFIYRTPYEAGELMSAEKEFPWKGLIWDTEDPAGARDFLRGLGKRIPIVHYDKGEVLEGIRKVRPFLRVREDGLPGLIICRTCKDAIWEMLAYHFRDYAEGRPVDENPEKVDDHFPDCLKQFVIAVMERRPIKITVGGRSDTANL